MKFSTRTTYGLRAMIFLAKNYNDDNVSLRIIAKKENISLSYLERLFANLKKAKLIESEKGVTGGYKLAKNPKIITIYDIVTVLEGKLTPFYCLSEDGKVKCEAGKSCGASVVLSKVQIAIKKTLKNIKLSDLK